MLDKSGDGYIDSDEFKRLYSTEVLAAAENLLPPAEEWHGMIWSSDFGTESEDANTSEGTPAEVPVEKAPADDPIAAAMAEATTVSPNTRRKRSKTN